MRRTLSRCVSLSELQVHTAHGRLWHERPCRRTLSLHPSPCSCSTSSLHFQATRRFSQQHGNGGHYFDPPFWDKTYSKETEPLEWYRSYSELCHLLKKNIPTNSRVLMSGCGNSEFSADMVKDGYANVVNIDISPVVISAMQKKYRNLPQLTYMTMDAVDLSSFDKSSFDAVIDKGTMDAIMCVDGGPYSVAMMLAEISRILKAGGVYMLVTFASPHVSFPLLNRDAFGWNIDTYIICEPQAPPDGRKPYQEPILLNFGEDADDNVVEKAGLYVYMCHKP